jgi:hypothetical protein
MTDSDGHDFAARVRHIMVPIFGGTWRGRTRWLLESYFS